MVWSGTEWWSCRWLTVGSDRPVFFEPSAPAPDSRGNSHPQPNHHHHHYHHHHHHHYHHHHHHHQILSEIALIVVNWIIYFGFCMLLARFVISLPVMIPCVQAARGDLSNLVKPWPFVFHHELISISTVGYWCFYQVWFTQDCWQNITQMWILVERILVLALAWKNIGASVGIGAWALEGWLYQPSGSISSPLGESAPHYPCVSPHSIPAPQYPHVSLGRPPVPHQCQSLSRPPYYGRTVVIYCKLYNKWLKPNVPSQFDDITFDKDKMLKTQYELYFWKQGVQGN